jgi:hypothetical protein
VFLIFMIFSFFKLLILNALLWYILHQNGSFFRPKEAENGSNYLIF